MLIQNTSKVQPSQLLNLIEVNFLSYQFLIKRYIFLWTIIFCHYPIVYSGHIRFYWPLSVIKFSTNWIWSNERLLFTVSHKITIPKTQIRIFLTKLLVYTQQKTNKLFNINMQNSKLEPTSRKSIQKPK